MNENALLSKIAQILFESSSNKYDSIHLEYALSEEEEWDSLSIYLIVNNEKEFNEDIDLEDELYPLLEELHSEMKNTSESNWTKLSLSINRCGEVNTDFDYIKQEL